MKILVTGANGLLGQKLCELLQTKADIELVATARRANMLAQGKGVFENLDICDDAQVTEVFERHRPDVIINCAAMTLVDKCELEQEACWKANVEAVENMVAACAVIGARFIQVSTDFIFDGGHGPLTEEDEPSPVNFYGVSKLAAEKIVMKSRVRWCILRTVLVYGVVGDMSRSNIVLWVKESLEQGKEIKVVNDQFRTPTLAEDLAMACYLAAVKNATGIYNVSGKDLITPYDIAIRTATYFDLDRSLIRPVDSTIFRQPARRPLRTGFIIEKARKELGYEPHSFDEGLAIIARQIAKVTLS